MFFNFLKTSLRIFRRNKAFTAINVLGLSIGISATLVIFLITQFEFGYDKMLTGGNQVYRVVMDMKFNGNDGHSAAVPAPLSDGIRNEITGVEATVPVMQFQGDATAKVSIERKGFDQQLVFKKQPNIIFTNPQYFSLLPFQWVAGSPEISLRKPFSVVLTESRARKYFSSGNLSEIVGKQIRYNDDFNATVSGIVKDLDARTTFSSEEFISFSTIASTHMQHDFMMEKWDDWMGYSQLYVRVSKGSNLLNLNKQINRLFNKYNKDANKDAANYLHLQLQPLSDVHFNSLYAGVGQRLAHKPTLYGLLAVAMFLLALACINFINLTTGNDSRRAKEIGIRKTTGSSKSQLIAQFLGETFLLTSAASILSFCLAPILLRIFSDFTPPGLKFAPFEQPWILLFLLLLAVLMSVIAGIYPAFILASYKPIQVLKAQSFTNPHESRNAWVRKTLSVSQFVIAQFFVIATVMVSKQIHYELTADLGFKKDAILTFSVPSNDTLAIHRSSLLNEIKNIPGVLAASRGFLTPADEGAAFTDIKYEGAANDKQESVQLRWGDSNYLSLFHIQILAGRNVVESDTVKEFLVNETYAKMLGFKHPGDALNKQLEFNGMKMPIVGVMRDFHQSSFRSNLGPLVFASLNSNSYFFHVALVSNSSTWPATIAKIQQAFKHLYPDDDFQYNFFDETIAKFYEIEQNTARLLTWATGLSVLISCLGLLGLVMYTTNTRTKEIGIRKILGASITNIITILSKDFVKLVVIAFLIAAPLAWWASKAWLQDFAYRTSLSWWVFAASGMVMVLAALITLSIQTVKAAIQSPVKNLRSE